MINSWKQCMVSAVGFIFLLNGLRIPPAQGCISTAKKGDTVQIAQEIAAIIWDPAHGVEHFIRQATFNTKAKDFGFLVPTPTTPDLAEARQEGIGHLVNLSTIQPDEIPASDDERTAGLPASAGTPAVVQIIKSQRVGRMDAVVLQANDVKALLHWLNAHGYVARPALNSWLEPYVKAKWKITAFKIAPEAGPGTGVASSLVRMSFPTHKPFFPYREPSDQREGTAAKLPRLLKVYFLSDGPVKGCLSNTDGWPGRADWSRPVDEAERTSLSRDLTLWPNQLPSKMWLTVFSDNSSPRPGTADVYFQPAPPNDRNPFPDIPGGYHIGFRPAGISFPKTHADRAANLLDALVGAGLLIAASFGIMYIYLQRTRRRR